MHGSRQFIEMEAIEWNLEIKSLQLEMFNFTIVLYTSKRAKDGQVILVWKNKLFLVFCEISERVIGLPIFCLPVLT